MRRLLLFCLALALPAASQPLPGTQPLTLEGDLASLMLEGIDRHLDRATRDAAARRPMPDRGRLRRILGVVDERVAAREPWFEGPSGGRVRAVRWAVLPGVDAEGLLFFPPGAPRASVVALPDADQTPEMFAPVAARLAENGCLVLVPTLIDRRDTYSANPSVGRATNQPHREFLYRMAFEAGRHIIGYEVQKALAAVDWFAASAPKTPVGVFGYGEGGLLAFYAAALDERIGAAAVTGYFGPREALWKEPIYRNVWTLLRDFGDSGVARLIAPRALVVEASHAPEVSGPPPDSKERRGAAPGAIVTPPLSEVKAEAARAGTRIAVTTAPEETLRAFLGALGIDAAAKAAPALPLPPVDAEARLRRQFDALVEYTQGVVRRSEAVRKKFGTTDIETRRRYLWEQVIGRLPDPSEPMSARTRRVYDEPRWTGYEVVLPVWPDVFAQGVLLVPKDLKPGERRPVVVCQHGLEGRPSDVIDTKKAAYARFAARLVEEGFVVYAPQNPYIFGNRFRQLQRKAYPLGLTLFSFIVGQHQRTTDWLAALPFVDPSRIGFYGLSYGGKTAMRVPPLVARYALSICSGDFNEWTWKNTSYAEPFSYMYTGEYEMYEFDLANTLGYAEMAELIAPRPFMVERGHRDGVGIDEWVAYEYAKVRRHYLRLGIPEKTAIEFFDGPHQIHGVGTFEFLRRHLGYTQP